MQISVPLARLPMLSRYSAAAVRMCDAFEFGSAYDASAAQSENRRLRLHAAVDYLQLPSVASTKARSEISKPNPYRARNRKFESTSLQERVCEPSVPEPALLNEW